MTQLSLNPTGRTGYAGQRRRSPAAMAAAVAFNGGVIAILIAMPGVQKAIVPEPILEIWNVRELKDPPPVKEEPVKTDPVKTQKTLPQQEELPYVLPPVLPLEGTNVISGTSEIKPDVITPTYDPPLPPVVKHTPTFVGATRDPRFASVFTPAYPPALVRDGLEGSVTVRVTINEKGRVIACELVKATNMVFFEETKEQALRRWRFRPATSDGVAVQSQQTLTVHFELN